MQLLDCIACVVNTASSTINVRMHTNDKNKPMVILKAFKIAGASSSLLPAHKTETTTSVYPILITRRANSKFQSPGPQALLATWVTVKA